ncbi:MAG: helix-turn-helix transcriptional regulator [Bacteriovoracaceae bacterium]
MFTGGNYESISNQRQTKSSPLRDRSLNEKNRLSNKFIANAVEIGLYYEGVFDLFELWAKEEDEKERDQIIADLQEEIDEYKEQPKEPLKKPYIKYTDLEIIAQNVVGFKAHLKTLVDNWGGISKLAKATEIPQPSLSRFFNTPSMPRRTTLYKIADALNLSLKKRL